MVLAVLVDTAVEEAAAAPVARPVALALEMVRRLKSAKLTVEHDSRLVGVHEVKSSMIHSASWPHKALI